MSSRPSARVVACFVIPAGMPLRYRKHTLRIRRNSKAMSDPGAVRRGALARLLAARGFVRVADASLELGVSEVTIRTDLSALERDGRAVRVHGGAMPVDALVRESPVESTRDRQAAAKRAIGVASAALVSSGDCVYLDAGSTALAL